MKERMKTAHPHRLGTSTLLYCPVTEHTYTVFTEENELLPSPPYTRPCPMHALIPPAPTTTTFEEVLAEMRGDPIGTNPTLPDPYTVPGTITGIHLSPAFPDWARVMVSLGKGLPESEQRVPRSIATMLRVGDPLRVTLS